MKQKILTISLTTGDDAFQTPDQIAKALRDIGEKVKAGRDGGVVQDENGNTVGDWQFLPT